VSAFALSLLLQLGMLAQPPVLPPEPDPAPPSDPPADPNATVLPAGLEPVEFPLEHAPAPGGDEPLPRMEPSPTSQAPAERRSIVDLRDPFNRPPVRPRNPVGHGEHAPQQRLLMPDLKDPFADGTRRVRSRTLDLRVPSDLRDPFREGDGRKQLPCVRTTDDGTVVQAPGAPRRECTGVNSELHDPFRSDNAKLPPPPTPAATK
jgi:hypothetical protein